MDTDLIVNAYVQAYDIEVPQEDVEEEYFLMCQEHKHRIQYECMIFGNYNREVDQDLERQENEMRQAAYLTIKRDLVIEDLIRKMNVQVSQDELEAEAKAIAERQKTTIEMMKSFLGEDLHMLVHDLQERKVIDWICQQNAAGTSKLRGK